MPDKMVRVPCSSVETKQAIEEELSSGEMLSALVELVKEKREYEDVDPTDIEAHDSIKSIEQAHADGQITEKRMEQLKIVGRRRGLTRF